VYSIPLSLARPPTRLGTAHMFVPSAHTGRVWLAGTDCHRPRMTGVREVTVDGDVTAEGDRRVPGDWVAGAVGDGLVLNRDGTMVVWDPVTGRIVRRFDADAIGEVHGSLIAACTPGCGELVIVDAAAGRKTMPRAGRGYRLHPGAKFSPDGSHIATAAAKDRRFRVAVVDVRDGSHELVPGRWRSNYPEFGWSGSAWLLIRGGRGRVTAYRPGAQQAIDLPFRLPKHAGTFVTG
jgi:hypothetical protein